VNINKLCNDDEHAARLLRISTKDLPKLNPEFSLTIKEIKTQKDAEINQELFDAIYGKDTVKSNEEFLQRIGEDIGKMYEKESYYKFAIDIRETLIAKADLKFPETFLKKWLMFINKSKFTEEQIGKEFDTFLKDLCWQTICSNIASKNNIQVTEEEIKEEAIQIAYRQLKQYRMNYSETQIKDYVKRILDNEDRVHEITEKILNSKVTDFLKTIVKLDEKTVDFVEFVKFFEEKE
jgi:trigger factor